MTTGPYGAGNVGSSNLYSFSYKQILKSDNESPGLLGRRGIGVSFAIFDAKIISSSAEESDEPKAA